jgi:ketosteroid isomerase-like protein
VPLLSGLLLRDASADLVDHLRRDLVHAVLLARMHNDLAEDLVVGLALEGGPAPGDQRAAFEFLHLRTSFSRWRLTVRPPLSDSFGAVPEASEFAARVYAAINARDRGAITALCAPDIVVGTTVEAYRGPEAVLDWLDEGDDAFDDFSVELLAVEELAGHVVVSMRQRGRGKASGAEVDHRFTHVWTLRYGRAIRMQSFAHRDDAVRYAQQSGGPEELAR